MTECPSRCAWPDCRDCLSRWIAGSVFARHLPSQNYTLHGIVMLWVSYRCPLCCAEAVLLSLYLVAMLPTRKTRPMRWVASPCPTRAALPSPSSVITPLRRGLRLRLYPRRLILIFKLVHLFHDGCPPRGPTFGCSTRCEIRQGLLVLDICSGSRSTTHNCLRSMFRV